MSIFRSWFFPFLVLISLGWLAACGVKGPPLPPVAGNPADSEREDRMAMATPSPTPSPSVTPKPAPKKKRQTKSE